MTSTGRIVQGTVSAVDDVHLGSQLETASLELITCKPVRFGADFSLSRYVSRVGTRDLIQLFVQLEQLQSAGISLVDSLTNIREATVNRHLHDMLLDLHRNITEGQSLSEAMAHHTAVFDNMCRSLIASGEQSGDMVAAYRYLIKHLKWADDMKRRVRKATRYPIVVIAVVLIAVVVMMALVVPSIMQFFEFISEDEALPLPTLALVATSEFFRAWWWAMIGGMAAAVAAVLAGKRFSEDFALRVDRIMLQAPLFGPLVRKLNIARFVQTVSALYAAGIPFLDAVKTGRDTIDNRVLREAANEVRENMKAGKAFSHALTATGEFPVMVPLMIKTGEETGKMAEVLEQIAEFYNADVDEEVQKLIAMIEPGLTALLGGLILWIAIGVFGPIYTLFEDLDM